MTILFVLILGILIGILIDRCNIRSFIRGMDDELEKHRVNFDLLGEWLTMLENNETIEKHLLERDIHSIAIYGVGVIGNHVIKELENSEITIKYLMDRNDVNGLYKVKICKPGEHLDGIDAIVVTPLYHFESIRSTLTEVNQVPILSIRDVLHTDRISDSPLEK